MPCIAVNCAMQSIKLSKVAFLKVIVEMTGGQSPTNAEALRQPDY